MDPKQRDQTKRQKFPIFPKKGNAAGGLNWVALLILLFAVFAGYFEWHWGPTVAGESIEVDNNSKSVLNLQVEFLCHADILDYENFGTSLGERQDAVIAIKDGKIENVFTGAEARQQEQSTSCLNLEGKIVIPGLIDAHVHLSLKATNCTEGRNCQITEVSDCSELELTLDELLKTGITTAADLGMSPSIAACLGAKRSPINILFAGEMITHLGKSGNIDTRNHICGLSYVKCIDTPDEARALIRQRTQAGVPFLKIWDVFNVDSKVRHTLIQEANANNLLVIEHMVYCINRVDIFNDPAILKPDVFAHGPLISKCHEPNIFDQEDHLELVYNGMINKRIRLITTLNVAHLPERQSDALEIIEKILDGNKIPIALGTDAGYAAPFGSSFLVEYKLLAVPHGNELALRAATIGAAEMFRQQANIGNIRPGKAADLVVLNKRGGGGGAPSADELKDLCMVIKSGRIVFKSATCTRISELF